MGPEGCSSLLGPSSPGKGMVSYQTFLESSNGPRFYCSSFANMNLIQDWKALDGINVIEQRSPGELHGPRLWLDFLFRASILQKSGELLWAQTNFFGVGALLALSVPSGLQRIFRKSSTSTTGSKCLEYLHSSRLDLASSLGPRSGKHWMLYWPSVAYVPGYLESSIGPRSFYQVQRNIFQLENWGRRSSHLKQEKFLWFK